MQGAVEEALCEDVWLHAARLGSGRRLRHHGENLVETVPRWIPLIARVAVGARHADAALAVVAQRLVLMLLAEPPLVAAAEATCHPCPTRRPDLWTWGQRPRLGLAEPPAPGKREDHDGAAARAGDTVRRRRNSGHLEADHALRVGMARDAHEDGGRGRLGGHGRMLPVEDDWGVMRVTVGQ